MAGVPVTAQDLNSTAGDISLQTERVARRITEMKQYLDAFSAQDLADKYGISIDDANLIKSAYGELDLVAQAQAANHTFSARLAGLGDVY